MPSSSRVKPRARKSRAIVHAEPEAVAGGARAAARPGAGLAGTGRAARPQRRRRGARRRRRRRGERPAPGVAGRAGRRTRSSRGSPSSAPQARAMLDHVDENGGQATAGSARHTVLPEDAAHPGRGAARPPAAGAARRRRRRRCPARSGWRCAAAAPRASRSTSPPEVATSARDQALVDRAAAGAAFEAVRRVELLLDHWGTEPPERPAQRRARGARPQGDGRPAARRRADRRRCWSRWPPRPGCSPTGADASGDPVWLPDRRLRRVDRARRRRPVGDAGPRLARDEPGARPGRRTRRRRQGAERPGTRAVQRVRRREPADGARGAGRAAAGRGARDRHRHPVAWSPGSPGCGRAARGPAPTRWCGRWTRRPPSASPGSAGCPPRAARCWPARTPKAAATLAPLLPEPVDHVLIQADLTAVAPGPARVVAGPPAAAGRRRRVARRRHGLPVHAGLGAPGARRRLVGRRGARVRRVGVADAGAAAADLPGRRHRPHVRHASGSGTPRRSCVPTTRRR